MITDMGVSVIHRSIPIITTENRKLYVRTSLDLNRLRMYIRPNECETYSAVWDDVKRQKDSRKKTHVLSSDCLARYDPEDKSIEILVNTHNNIRHYTLINTGDIMS